MMSVSPTISVGLAVRNAIDVVGRCVESIISQDFTDIELVISDNASDDGTSALLEKYASGDRRIKLSTNKVNIGIHENMNRVLQRSRAEFFRWISSDDWLEPGCLSACVRAVGNWDDAIGVTTAFAIHTADGFTKYERYGGEFPTSPDPAQRFERMLWFFHSGDAKYDPIYGMYRRDALTRSHRLRPSEKADWLLAAELALKGPIIHVDRRLSNRTKSYSVHADRAGYRDRLDPVRAPELKTSPQRLHRDLLELVMKADLTDEQVRRCKRALRRLWIEGVVLRTHGRLAGMRHRVLGR
jgi:glycosyltransferase involved in cell wall biosynthesis